MAFFTASLTKSIKISCTPDEISLPALLRKTFMRSEATFVFEGILH